MYQLTRRQYIHQENSLTTIGFTVTPSSIVYLLGYSFSNRFVTSVAYGLISIPLNRSSPESAYVILENAWFSWYQW